MNKIIIYVAILVLVVAAGSRIVYDEAWDFSEIVHENDYGVYLMEEKDIDVTDFTILNKAYELKQDSTSPRDAIQKTADFIYYNIEYDASTSISYCYSEKASTVLEARSGDCVGMSRLLVALLRAQGIPARTAGGCINLNPCVYLFAVAPTREVRVVPITEGDFKKRGYLHEWVEAWTPDEGWFIIEPTTGYIFSKECMSYLHYHYDDNPFDRCVITNRTFLDICSEY